MKQLETSCNSFRLYRLDEELESSNLPENTYILCSENSRSILYRPYLAGLELHECMKNVSLDYINSVKHLLQKKRASEVVELVYLAGGLYYFLSHGFSQIFKKNLPQCFIGIQRSRIEGTEGSFTAKMSYENFESLPDNATVLIGDTIATGATMAKGLLALEAALQEKNYSLNEIIIFSLAAATEGLRKIKRIEEKLKLSFPDSKLTLVVSEQLFTLMPNGTDMHFFGNDSIMPEETRAHTLKEYGEWLGNHMQCAVFDWGTRCKNPMRHYREFLEYIEKSLAFDITEEVKQKILSMKEATEKRQFSASEYLF